MSITRIAGCDWSSHAGNQTNQYQHSGLVFSRMSAWPAEDVVSIVNSIPTLAEILKYPQKAYFIIDSPPTHDIEDKNEHPLYRKPIGNSWYTDTTDGNYDELVHRRENPWKLSKMSPDDSTEFRYLVVPSIETVFSHELHPSSLSYRFHIVVRGHLETFTYRQLWNRCPLVQGIFHGYTGCPKCDIRGINCVYKWFMAELEDRLLPVDDLGEYISHTDHMRVNVMYKQIDALSEEYDVITGTLGQPPLPNTGVKKRKFKARPTTRGLCKLPDVGMFLDRSNYSPKDTDLTPSNIRANHLSYKRNARKAAETRKHHGKVCGLSGEECMLKDRGCTRWKNAWRTTSCSNRWHSAEEMLKAGIEPFKKSISYTELDFQVALPGSGHRFRCLNPDTGRTVEAYYGGLAFEDGQAQHIIVRNANGHITRLFQGSWRELRRFIRRTTPWKREYFWQLEENAPKVKVTDEAKVFYAECAVVPWFYYRGMWSAGCRDVAFAEATTRFGFKDIYNQKTLSVSLDAEYHHSYHFSGIDQLVEERNWTWFRWIPD